MRRLCLETVTLQTDSEPAALDFANKVKAARTETTHVRHAPRHSSQSMGSVESAIQYIG
jgi:hypothetical protein